MDDIVDDIAYSNLLANYRVIEAIGGLIARRVPLQDLFSQSAQIMADHLALALVCWWGPVNSKLCLLACVGDTAWEAEAQSLALTAITDNQPGVRQAPSAQGTLIGIALDGAGPVRYVLTLASTTPNALTRGQTHLLETLAESLTYYFKDRERELSLVKLGLCDTLTGLPNRARFMQLLRQVAAEEHSPSLLTAVCILDLDHFKEINDTLGHLAGDHLLHALGGRFMTAVGGAGTVARLGGDEFGILLVNLNGEAALDAICSRVLASTKPAIALADLEIQINASLGVTVCYGGPSTAVELLRQADVALYSAKRGGKNTWRRFSLELDRASQLRHEIRQSFLGSLEAGELEVHYQPVVSMQNYEVIGVEALVRWPSRGVPGTFLPIVEAESVLIRALGQYVLKRALTDLTKWHAEGLRLRLAVNIGARHLLHPEFIHDMTTALAEHPGKADWLTLEITESAALSDLDATTLVMEQGRELGISWAIDDFGTGHASMQYLQRLPANSIKLDHSFVRGMLDRVGDFAVVSGTLLAAKLKGLRVIAEGVETADLGKMLLRLGCDAAQGFWIAKPMPAASLSGWVAQWAMPEDWDVIPRVAFPLSDMELLMASTVHREGIQTAIAALLRARTENTPFMSMPSCVSADVCRFGQWLNTAGIRYRAFPELDPVRTTHNQVHRLIQDISLQQASGGAAPAIDEQIAKIMAGAAALDIALRALIQAVEFEVKAPLPLEKRPGSIRGVGE